LGTKTQNFSSNNVSPPFLVIFKTNTSLQFFLNFFFFFFFGGGGGWGGEVQ